MVQSESGDFGHNAATLEICTTLQAIFRSQTMSTASKLDPALQAQLWLAAVDAVDCGGDAELGRLQTLSRKFILGEWLAVALAQGWDALELFGVFPCATQFAARRLDCLGLVPMLGLGSLGGRLVEIGTNAAIIEGRDGNRHRHARRLGGQPWAIVWWEFHNPEEGQL